MSGSHTPGPWQRSEETGISQYAESVVAKSHRGKTITVARIASGPDRREDDCRLIAAAPDLLEALEQLLSGIASCAKMIKPATADEILRTDTFSRAQSAISKARGE